MVDNTDLLKQILSKLDEQGRDIKSLKKGQETLELKVEAFHTEQTKANTEILTILTDMHEVDAEETKKRFEELKST